MKFLLNIRLYIALFAFSLLGLVGCVDQDFDEPPVGDLPSLEANSDIATLKALHTLGGNPTLIEEDFIIRGIAISSDREGNFFKQLYIQDATGGIEIRLDRTDLYNDFPVGREVFVLCKGLYISDFRNNYQISAVSIDPADGSINSERIASGLIDEFIVRGSRDQAFSTTVVTIDELSSSSRRDELVGTLIQIDEVQFVSSSINKAFADAVQNFSVNHNLTDCKGNEIILRSSGFADFANDLTPGGNGSVVGLLSVFDTDIQLYIRDLADLTLTGERCEGGNNDCESGDASLSLKCARALFEGGSGSAPAGKVVSGVVISDKDNGNWNGRNVVIQDASGGIAVRFSDNHNFALGEILEVDVAGQELSEFNGLLQINDVPLGNATSTGMGELPQPRVATISDIISNAEAWESTLVTIEKATISGSATFNGNITITDGTGSIGSFTRSSASFANTNIPSGEVTITAVVSQFDDPQITIRSINDIK